jgi:hypothetical protein
MAAPNFVLAGLDPATHAWGGRNKDVDTRIKSAQDDFKSFSASPIQVNLVQIEIRDRRILVKDDRDTLRPKARGDREIRHDLRGTAHCVRKIIGFEREPRMRVGHDKEPVALRVARGTE